jgi:hypothetical protein
MPYMGSQTTALIQAETMGDPRTWRSDTLGWKGTAEVSGSGTKTMATPPVPVLIIRLPVRGVDDGGPRGWPVRLEHSCAWSWIEHCELASGQWVKA